MSLNRDIYNFNFDKTMTGDLARSPVLNLLYTHLMYIPIHKTIYFVDESTFDISDNSGSSLQIYQSDLNKIPLLGASGITFTIFQNLNNFTMEQDKEEVLKDLADELDLDYYKKTDDNIELPNNVLASKIKEVLQNEYTEDLDLYIVGEGINNITKAKTYEDKILYLASLVKNVIKIENLCYKKKQLISKSISFVEMFNMYKAFNDIEIAIDFSGLTIEELKEKCDKYKIDLFKIVTFGVRYLRYNKVLDLSNFKHSKYFEKVKQLLLLKEVVTDDDKFYSVVFKDCDDEELSEVKRCLDMRDFENSTAMRVIKVVDNTGLKLTNLDKVQDENKLDPEYYIFGDKTKSLFINLLRDTSCHKDINFLNLTTNDYDYNLTVIKNNPDLNNSNFIGDNLYSIFTSNPYYIDEKNIEHILQIRSDFNKYIKTTIDDNNEEVQTIELINSIELIYVFKQNDEILASTKCGNIKATCDEIVCSSFIENTKFEFKILDYIKEELYSYILIQVYYDKEKKFAFEITINNSAINTASLIYLFDFDYSSYNRTHNLCFTNITINYSDWDQHISVGYTAQYS